MATALSPEVLTTIQQYGLTELTKHFASIGTIAMALFAIIATIEVALFGLVWSYRQDSTFGALVFKVIKLSLIFFIISSYPFLLQHLIDGFTQVAGGSAKSWHQFVFNPAKVWQFGFDGSISLLKLSVLYGTANIGMSMIYLFIGFGILLAFALIGAQIVLVVLGFYIVSLLALLLLPLGSLSVCRGLLSRALQSVIQMGARVFGLIFVITIAVQVWQQFHITAWSQSTNLMAPLGLLTSAIVIGYLIIRIPTWCAAAVGPISGSLFDDFKDSGTANVSATASAIAPAVSSVAAGSAITPTVLAGTGSTATATSAQALQSATQINPQAGNNQPPIAAASGQIAGANRLMAAADKMAKTQSASQMQQGISNNTLRKLKSTFKQAMKEGK